MSISTGSTDEVSNEGGRPFSVFGRRPGDIVVEAPNDRRAARERPDGRREAKPFERLFGTLSLADLNEYRMAAGREPDLDARALYALNEAADRFFPGGMGSPYLRNAYLKYLSERADIAEIVDGTLARPVPFGMSAAA